MLKWILNRNLFKLLMSKDIHFHSFYFLIISISELQKLWQTVLYDPIYP